MATTVTLNTSIVCSDSVTGEDVSTALADATITGVEYKERRNLQITTTVATILQFGAAVAAGQLISTDGVMFINRDTTNFVTLGFIVSGAKAFYIKLPPQRFFTIWTKDLDVNTSGGVFSAFTSVTSITAKADTASCIVDFIALD